MQIFGRAQGKKKKAPTRPSPVQFLRPKAVRAVSFYDLFRFYCTTVRVRRTRIRNVNIQGFLTPVTSPQDPVTQARFCFHFDIFAGRKSSMCLLQFLCSYSNGA